MAEESGNPNYEAAFWRLFEEIISKCYLSCRDVDRDLVEESLQAASKLDGNLMYQKVKAITDLYFDRMVGLSESVILDFKSRVLNRAFALGCKGRWQTNTTQREKEAGNET